MRTKVTPKSTPSDVPSLRHILNATLVAASLTCISTREAHSQANAAPLHTENVVLITIDGLRWQEVFDGADNGILASGKAGDSVSVADLRARFWRESPSARRTALMPFMWQSIGANGQIFGNRRIGSSVKVTNGRNFSYPGYSEILTGYPDPRIDSNDKIPNSNVTVLEWLNTRPRFHDRVVAFASWDVFPFIINAQRSGIPVNAGWEPVRGEHLSPTATLLNRLMVDTPHEWENARFDAYTFEAALEYVRQTQPRVLYLALDEPDDWAHAGRYDRYLESTHRADGFVRMLWEAMQQLPTYRGRTTFLITTDHGRGEGISGWTDHGSDVKDSEYTWIAALGPDTEPLGERHDTPELTAAQLAATAAALLGEDYSAVVSRAGEPIWDITRSTRR